MNTSTFTVNSKVAQMAGQLGNAVNNLSSSAYLRAGDATANVMQKLPQPLQRGAHAYNHFVHNYERNPATQVMTQMGQAQGKPDAFLPHHVTLPIEAVHKAEQGLHGVTSLLGGGEHH